MTSHTGSAIILWSVPRARSTAFERMMFERKDHVTVHEPFSRVCDFGKSEVDGVTCHTERDVVNAIDALSAKQSVFVKDTLDFRFEEVLQDGDFLRRHRHCVMIRDPHEAVASYLRLDPAATAQDVGFVWLAELAELIEEVSGKYPYVVEAARLMKDPQRLVHEYCAAVGIKYMPEALDFRRDPPASWRSTERWHEAAVKSAALGRAQDGEVPQLEVSASRLESIVSEVTPAYEHIRSRAVSFD